MEKANYEFLDKLNGIKKVVLGNHDKPQHTRRLLNHVNCVGGAVRYKKCFLTHIPIVESELRRCKYNIHGHVHENSIETNRKYVNVSCEVINYTPVDIDKLIYRKDLEENAINKYAKSDANSRKMHRKYFRAKGKDFSYVVEAIINSNQHHLETFLL